MTCLKAQRLCPRKMKCEVVNVCLEGAASLIELPSMESEGFSSGHPASPKEEDGQLRSQPATGTATAGTKGAVRMSAIHGLGKEERVGVLLSWGLSAHGSLGAC